MKSLSFVLSLMGICNGMIVDNDDMGTVFMGDTYSTTYPMSIGRAINQLYSIDLPYSVQQNLKLFDRLSSDITIDILDASRTSELLSDFSLLPMVLKTKNGQKFNGIINLNIYTTDVHDGTHCASRATRVRIKCHAGEYYKHRVKKTPDLVTYFDADIRHQAFVPTIADILDSGKPALISMSGKPGESCNIPGQNCFEVSEVLKLLGARVLLPLQENIHASLHEDPVRGVHGQNVHTILVKGRSSQFAYGWHSATNMVRSLFFRDLAENHYEKKLQDRDYSSWLAIQAEKFRTNELTNTYPLNLSLHELAHQLLQHYRNEINKCHAEIDASWATGRGVVRTCKVSH